MYTYVKVFEYKYYCYLCDLRAIALRLITTTVDRRNHKMHEQWLQNTNDWSRM